MKRWISAPKSDSCIVSGTILGVWIDDDERVDWTYTILPDGTRVVTGYDILPFAPEKE